MTVTVTPPTVHLNGSGKTNLIEGYRKALEALVEAQDALSACSPHMRDFYVQKDCDAVFRHAVAQHNARQIALRNIHEEIEALAMAVVDQ